jgi:hypothetical protein
VLTRTRTGTVDHIALNVARLPFRHEHADRNLEDQVGLEPTKLAQRVKRPLPLPLGALVRSVLEDAGGFEPHADGLKVRSRSIWVEGSASRYLVLPDGLEPPRVGV